MDESGRFVAFTSTATNLDLNFTANGKTQVYVHDTCSESTTGCTASTFLISVSSDGVNPAADDATQPSVSSDGRFVAFVSMANNLVAGLAPTTMQVFLRDTCNGQSSTGCVPTTILVSTSDAAVNGTTPANAAATNPVVGNNGAFVSFSSAATNLATPNPNTLGVSQIWVRTTCLNTTASCTPATTLISTPDGATAGNAASLEPAMTSDGRFFAFASTATNLVTTPTLTGTQQIFVRDTCTGAPTTPACTPSTSLITVDAGGNPGNDLSEEPQISSKGQIVAYASKATNLVSTTVNNGFENVFARNTCVNVASGTTCNVSTVLASVSSTQALGNGNSNNPSLASDGKSISFLSAASNLVTFDTNNAADIFLAVTTF